MSDETAVRVPPAEVAPGRETDARVARALGHEVMLLGGALWERHPGSTWGRLAPYSTDWGAAWLALTSGAFDGYEAGTVRYGKPGEMFCRVWTHDGKRTSATAMAAPLACVRAALAALEGDPR